MPRSLQRCCPEPLSLSQTSRARPGAGDILSARATALAAAWGWAEPPAPHQALEVGMAAQDPHRAPTSWQMN